MKKGIVFILIASIFSGCVSVVKVQKSEDYIKDKSSVKKVICIAPELVYFKGSNLSAIDFKKTFDYQSFLFKRLEKYSSKAANFKFEIYHPLYSDTLGADYFNSLLPLKSELLETLFERDINVNNPQYIRSLNTVQKSVFAEPPKISPEYAYLSSIYGTPYFSWYGIVTSNGLSVVTFVIVNVETTEVVVREIIFANKRINKRNLPPLIYDSFTLIK